MYRLSFFMVFPKISGEEPAHGLFLLILGKS